MKNEKLSTLFPYILTSDTGFAPNPYGGICTLVTCKPKIRKKAKVGDWIIGIYSKAEVNKHKGGHRGKLVYAMEVTGKMCLKCYDKYCKTLKIKIPLKRETNGKTLSRDEWEQLLEAQEICSCDKTYKKNAPKIKSSKKNETIEKEEKILRKEVGDCFLDFPDNETPKLRYYRHINANPQIKKDIDGNFALLSTNYFYMGRNGCDEHKKNLVSNGLKELKTFFDLKIKLRNYPQISLCNAKVKCLKNWVKKNKTIIPIEPIDQGKITKKSKKTSKKNKRTSFCHGC